MRGFCNKCRQSTKIIPHFSGFGLLSKVPAAILCLPPAMTAVHFYTSCTQTKSAPASPSLSAKSLLASSVAERFDAWRERLDGWKGDRWTALDLYCGGHWSVMRNLVSGSQIGLPPLRSYAISAGYGIISTAARIAPYAATFAVGHEDSISCARGKNAPFENAEWWHDLTSWKPKGVQGPRSIRGVFKSARDSVHLFALSPSYLDAISDDLLAGREELFDPEKLIIVSNGKKRHGPLNSSVVTAPAALQTVVGGALAFTQLFGLLQKYWKWSPTAG